MDIRNKTCLRESCESQFSTFDDRKIYCSQSCAAIVNNKKRGKEIPCKNKCGILIPKTATRIFCSLLCQRDYPITKWLTGEWDGSVKQGLSKTIRDYLLKEANYKCQDVRSGCGNWGKINPKSMKICLTIEHKDGNCYNNRPENLIVMCPNCHAMTETYGALNKGNGRKYRYLSE